MPPAVKMFEQLARPVSHAEDGEQWHAPVTSVQVAGGEFTLWCEMPRLDMQLDATPWLVLPDCPGGSIDVSRVLPLRRTDSPWWSFESSGALAADWGSLQDLDLQRLVDDICQVADWLGLRQFHVLGGGFSSVVALSLAAQVPNRVASLVLESLFLPLRPVAGTYLRALRNVDPPRYDSVFGSDTDPTRFALRFLELGVRDVAQACDVWVELESHLGLMQIRKDDPGLIRGRRTLAHLMMHDFFLSPDRWVQDVGVLASHAMSITLVQGLGDRVCLPSAARFFADLLPHVCLVELPEVGHNTEGSLALSALSGAIVDHRRPRARLIQWPGQRTVRNPQSA